jgi:hypothetical protein
MVCEVYKELAVSPLQCLYIRYVVVVYLTINHPHWGGRKSTDVRDDGKKEQRWLERYLDALGVKAEEKKSE